MYFSTWKHVFDSMMVFVGIKTDRNIETVRKEQGTRNTPQSGKKSLFVHERAQEPSSHMMAALIFSLFSHIIVILSPSKQRKEAP